MKAFRLTAPERQRRGPDLTPVMDVVFILVVFFLVVSTFSETLVKPMQVSLPGSDATVTAPDVARLSLSTAGLRLDDEPVARDALAARLATLAGRPLAIVADSGAPYQMLVDALDAAQTAGLADVKVQAAQEVGQ
jgi:biopolymer transport protein ExbD